MRKKKRMNYNKIKDAARTANTYLVSLNITETEITDIDMKLLYILRDYGVIYESDSMSILSMNVNYASDRKKLLIRNRIIYKDHNIVYLDMIGIDLLRYIGYDPMILHEVNKKSDQQKNSLAENFRNRKVYDYL